MNRDPQAAYSQSVTFQPPEPPARKPYRPAPVRPTRETFLDAHMAADRDRARLSRTADGVIQDSRPYVALACGCRDDDCPGWALVHDDPQARAHFNRLFGVAGGGR